MELNVSPGDKVFVINYQTNKIEEATINEIHIVKMKKSVKDITSIYVAVCKIGNKDYPYKLVFTSEKEARNHLEQLLWIQYMKHLNG